MKIVIVIPTYNERENISELIPKIQAQRALLTHEIEVLVVDDESPDGTADAVAVLQDNDPKLHLLSGKKEGLGRAYTRGMAYALEILNADALIEMDADFSHDPTDLLRLIAELENGYDFVIGSRYVPGGSIPNNWGVWRRANSKYGNIMARFVAGMYAIRDCTAGYRCIRASIIKKINIKNIHSNGYCFQIEILHKAIRNGARVKEIPVHFVDRKVGKSKLGLSDILEFLVAVWKIRLNDSATFIKFCIVGLTGVGVNLGLLALLLAFDINKYVASPVAIQSSIVTNFFFNNSWTFRKRGLISAAVKAVRFNLVALLALGFSYSVFVLLSIFTTLHPLLAQAVGIVPAVFINYFLNLYWTWGE